MQTDFSSLDMPLLVLTLPYRPLLGTFYHTHELSNYSIVGVIEFRSFALRNVPKNQPATP